MSEHGERGRLLRAEQPATVASGRSRARTGTVLRNIPIAASALSTSGGLPATVWLIATSVRPVHRLTTSNSAARQDRAESDAGGPGECGQRRGLPSGQSVLVNPGVAPTIGSASGTRTEGCRTHRDSGPRLYSRRRGVVVAFAQPAQISGEDGGLDRRGLIVALAGVVGEQAADERTVGPAVPDEETGGTPLPPVAVGAPDQRNPPQQGAPDRTCARDRPGSPGRTRRRVRAPRSSRRSAISAVPATRRRCTGPVRATLVGEPATQRRMVGHQSGQRVPEPWWVERWSKSSTNCAL